MPDKVITKFRSFYGPYADCPSIVTAVKELSDISYAFESTPENSVFTLPSAVLRLENIERILTTATVLLRETDTDIEN